MIDEITIQSLSGRGSVTMATREYRGYWLGKVDWGQVSGQHNTYSYANQIGENIVSTSVNSRPISISGWVIEDQDTMQERCDFLNVFFSPVEDYALIYKDKKIGFRPDGSVKYGREKKENNKILRKFLLQGTAPYPLFTGVKNGAANFHDTTDLFSFPSTFGLDGDIPFGLVQKSYRATVNNEGGFETGILATIEFMDTVANPQIINVTTNKYIGVNYTFAAGDKMEVSTVPGSKYMRMTDEQGNETNLIRYRDVGMSWFSLQPGLNTVALSCEIPAQLDNMSLRVEYIPLYMEVE